jgi:amino acid adenylation domain-containing protein
VSEAEQISSQPLRQDGHLIAATPFSQDHRQDQTTEMNRVAFPASFAQQRLWFLDQLEPGTAAYNLARAFRITGPLDVGVLTRAIEAVVQRHESLRSVFDAVDGETRQIVLSDVPVQIPVVDLTDIPEDGREPEALRIACEEGRKSFDLTQGPLLRTVLVRLGSDQYLLVLAMHHIITDGWSIAVLFRELTRCYEAIANGQDANLPELPLQYSEYAQWQREYMTGEALARQVGYWKSKLAGAQTILDLPTDHPRPSSHSWHGSSEELTLGSDVLAELKTFAQNEGATLFMVAVAAFQALLRRYTMQDSILVGTPIAGRNELETENLVGLFVNTLIFRADFTDSLSFRDLVRQVRDFALDAFAHQDVPFEKLVEELVPQRLVDITPLFQVMFTFQNIPKQVFEIAGLAMKEIPFESGIAKFDLSVEVCENDGLHCGFEYNTDLFDKPTICRMLGHFRNLVSTGVRNPDLPLAEIPLMTPGEQRQLLVEWNNTVADYPRDVGIHQPFEQQALRSPDSTALIFQEQKITYQQLNQRANRLARYLIKRGVQPGALLGISLERSPEMVVALLAALKAGAAYVPLDPDYPTDRLAVMLQDSAVWGVVTHSAMKNKLLQHGGNIVALDTDGELIADESANNPSLSSAGQQRAYVIYTSGSSGMPKGVEGTHRGALNRFAWMWRTYPFHAGEVCCQKTNLGFVDSVWEIFGPLLAGVPSVIIPQEIARDPEELLQALAQQRVTRIVMVPSLLRTLLDHAPNLRERVPQLKLWSCSGEVLPADLAKRFLTAFPEATLLNIYGSSEVAADVTWHQVRDLEGAHSAPIGRPISNTQIYLVDQGLRPVPVGVRGQILVGGDGLAMGYWNRPELTAERFVEKPLAPRQSARLYCTGDLGRYRANGDIEYWGRVDSQIKLRGMRIEVREIEVVLASHPLIGQAVIALHGEGEQQKLAAYLVPRNGQPPGARELWRFLRSKLPEHMVPASYWLLKQLPLLPSGKVNRKALVLAEGVPLTDEGELALPSNDVERKLAGIWQELLEVEQVGIDQNFFELGGHSLLVLQMIARIRHIFEIELPVRSVFEEPTIVGLAEELEKAQALGLKARTPIAQRSARVAANSRSREALIAQLDNLSPAELQSLLKRVLDGKQPM